MQTDMSGTNLVEAVFSKAYAVQSNFAGEVFTFKMETRSPRWLGTANSGCLRQPVCLHMACAAPDPQPLAEG